MKKILSLLVVCLTVGGCATGINIKKYNPGDATKESFKQCRGFGCSYRVQTGFTQTEWKRVVASMKTKPAKNAAEERTKIAETIALMERIIGPKTGADADIAESSMTSKTPYQLDCIDETTNTTHYLQFLEEEGLLKFYKPGLPIHRGYFINGWPHNTATIRDRATNAQYAVDSYFHESGVKADIMPRDIWLDYWHPGDPIE